MATKTQSLDRYTYSARAGRVSHLGLVEGPAEDSNLGHVAVEEQWSLRRGRHASAAVAAQQRKIEHDKKISAQTVLARADVCAPDRVQ